MNKQEIINELSKLYRLQEEGKKIKNLIQRYEALLCQVCDDELDTETIDEKN
jgi:predicted transcriptional regulator with HTH domain